MKYLKIFIAILYLVFGGIISFAWPVLAYSNILLFNRYLLPQAFFLAILIGFFIYLLRIKDNDLYWSIFFLSLTINYAIIIIFNISNKIYKYIIWDKDGLPWFNEFFPYIFIWILSAVSIIGFILLHFYFKSRYRNKLKDEKSN